jgi:hypothetical protein
MRKINKNNTFSDLVEELNKKWGHTYEAPVPGDAKAEKDIMKKEEK